MNMNANVQPQHLESLPQAVHALDQDMSRGIAIPLVTNNDVFFGVPGANTRYTNGASLAAHEEVKGHEDYFKILAKRNDLGRFVLSAVPLPKNAKLGPAKLTADPLEGNSNNTLRITTQSAVVHLDKGTPEVSIRYVNGKTAKEPLTRIYSYDSNGLVA